MDLYNWIEFSHEKNEFLTFKVLKRTKTANKEYYPGQNYPSEIKEMYDQNPKDFRASGPPATKCQSEWRQHWDGTESPPFQQTHMYLLCIWSI